MRLLLGDGLEHVPVVLRLSPPEEVPTPSQRPHLLEVDPRRDELVAPRRRLREHLALRVDDARAGDQLDAVLHTRLGDADHEAEVRVRPGAHAELVEIERQRRDRRVVADQDDLGALQRERAIALGIAAVLAERDADFRADRIEDAIARVAVGEVVGLVDLGKAVDGLRARQVDLAERAAQTPVAVGEEGGVEVLAVCLLAEADVHGHARLGGATKQGLESLRRYLGLEELIEVGADFLGEVGRQRHLRIDDQLHAIARRRFEEGEHPLDDRLAGCPLLIGTHLGGGNFQVAWHPSLLSGGAGPAVPAFPGLSLHADTALSNTRQATSARDVSNRPASGRGVSNLRADCLTTRLPEWQMTYSGGSDHAQDAGNIRELEQYRRAESRRDHAGYVIGVDVVGRPVTPGRDGGDDGDQTVPIEKPERVRVDRLDVTDEPQIHALAVRQPVPAAVGHDQIGVLAVETDGVAAVLVDEAHELRIDAAHQHHLYELHRLVVGHAEAVDEARGLAEAPHKGVDLGPPAVDDDGVDSR